MTNKCTHETTSVGESRGFVGSVAEPPYTEENRAAHGGYTATEICLSCGAERSVNHNQWFVEVGTWGPDLATRRRRESEARIAMLEAQAAAEENAMQKAKMQLVDVRSKPGHYTMVDVQIGSEFRCAPLWQIEEAARQEDEDLALPYRGLLRAIRGFRPEARIIG